MCKSRFTVNNTNCVAGRGLSVMRMTVVKFNKVLTGLSLTACGGGAGQAVDPPPPPPVTTVVLQVGMHCEACAQALRRHIRKIPGVDSVQTDVANDLVTVKGVIEDPENLAQLVNNRTRKHASIVKEDNDKTKPADPKGDDQKDNTEKKKGDDNKDGGSSQGEDETKENDLLAKFEHCPTRAYMEYYYSNAPELFSDENPNACTVM